MWIMFRILLLVAGLGLSLASPAAAQDHEVVKDRAHFVSLVDGRSLSRIGVRLEVSRDGRILGRAFGRDVRGEWTWQAPYFCRSMQWGTEPLPYNCQTVRRIGAHLRFQSDRGTGDYADLRLD